MLLVPIAYSSVQHQVLTLLNGRASQQRVQRYPDRRRQASFLRRYVQQAIAEGMPIAVAGPWRLGWQHHSWAVGDAPTPQVLCGEYRVACESRVEAMEIRAMLNWYHIPEPQSRDRRIGSRGRRPRADRRGHSAQTGGQAGAEAARWRDGGLLEA